MAKLIVEIDLGPRTTKQDILNEPDWFPTGDPTKISVDSADLKIDPTEDSFYLFKLLEIKED